MIHTPETLVAPVKAADIDTLMAAADGRLDGLDAFKQSPEFKAVAEECRWALRLALQAAFYAYCGDQHNQAVARKGEGEPYVLPALVREHLKSEEPPLPADPEAAFASII